MHSAKIKKIVDNVKSGKLTSRAALLQLKNLPYADLQFAKFDHHRHFRRGFPEVVLASGKSRDQIKKITAHLTEVSAPIIITKAPPGLFRFLQKDFDSLSYDSSARIIFSGKLPKPKRTSKCVLLITAGTSDAAVADEADLILRLAGIGVKRLSDVGVAGIHRLFAHRKMIQQAAVCIVFAGMDGALPSVVSSLVAHPVIAVPTSIGYGANFKGVAPLLSMLNSCSPGIAVCNIDNGFGAAHFAYNILNMK